MSRGAKPGERRGGRTKGALNKETIARNEILERLVAEQAKQAADTGGTRRRKLGKEVLAEFVEMFGGLAAAFQPTGTGLNGALTAEDMEKWAKSYKEPLFEKYAKLAAKTADDVSAYESPKYGTVSVPAPPPPERGQTKKKFTIGIFDGQGRPAPKQITVKPIASKTAPAPAVPAPRMN